MRGQRWLLGVLSGRQQNGRLSLSAAGVVRHSWSPFLFCMVPRISAAEVSRLDFSAFAWNGAILDGERLVYQSKAAGRKICVCCVDRWYGPAHYVLRRRFRTRALPKTVRLSLPRRRT